MDGLKNPFSNRISYSVAAMSDRGRRNYETHAREFSRRERRSISPEDRRIPSRHSEYKPDSRDRNESSHRSHRHREDSHRVERERNRSRSPRKSKKKKSKKSKSKSKKKTRSETDSDNSESDDKHPDRANGGYSNVDNPFNDVNLTSKFKWAKKERKDIKSGLSKRELERREMERREEARVTGGL